MKDYEIDFFMSVLIRIVLARTDSSPALPCRRIEGVRPGHGMFFAQLQGGELCL
jgi:hypothetical protein